MEDIPSLDSLDSIQSSLTALEQSADRFGSSLVSSFARGVVAGRSFDDVLRGVGQRLVDMALSSALQPVQNLTGNFLSSLSSNLFGGAQMFADGGVVSRPTYFSTGGGLGVMGEAGSEAIMPLARGPDGRLGVRGGGTGSTVVNVTIATQDAESFRRSEAQVTAGLAKAVSRGRRAR